MKKLDKVASKIADLVVERANSALLNRIKEADLAREVEGKDALSNLRRLGSRKLPEGEEIVIARHLHWEIPALKRCLASKRISLGQFCIRSGISGSSDSSKELHRLVLGPGKDPAAVRLRRSGNKYYDLIKAISSATKESASSLADRVLCGTSLHPSRMENLTETELVQAALQGIVDKIDNEFGIHQKFMEIARLKSQHVAEGGSTNWPLEPFREISLEDEYDRLRRIRAVNPEYAFWDSSISRTASACQNGADSEDTTDDSLQADADTRAEELMSLKYFPGVVQDDGFFFVPHARIGILDMFNLRLRSSDPADYDRRARLIVDGWRNTSDFLGRSGIAVSGDIRDEFDSETNAPIGQTLSGRNSIVSADYGWLVIYPTADSSRLMPMLYLHQEESGAYLMPLDVRNLDILRDALWIDEARHGSVFDRIKELLGYLPSSRKAIEEGLRDTAQWLDHNPIFQLRDQKSDDLRLLGSFCRQIWNDRNSPAATARKVESK